MSSSSPTSSDRSRRAAPLPVPIHADGEFQLHLHHEQERIDRHGREQAVVVLHSASEPAPADWALRAQARVATRCRSTDRVGLLGADAVGVVLSFVEGAPAARIGENLREELARAGLAAEAVVTPMRPQVEAQRARRRTRASDTTTASGEGESAQVRWEPRGIQVFLARPLPRWKRAVDVVLASVGLVCLAPLMGLIALLILVTSGRPIFYAHERTGRALSRFRMFKFRTMRVSGAEGWEDVKHLNEMKGLLFKSDSDPRVLRFGKLLRKTSLDELPQLWNVLRGEMTLIGPRALSPRPEEYEPWQLRRFDVTPGLACTWQAERRDDTDTVAWMRSDLAYVERGDSLRGDLAILARVAWSLLFARGGR
jgi:lipopolysaccharide/colanic/teichoic acid biosynthesis glycosyltransferase